MTNAALVLITVYLCTCILYTHVHSLGSTSTCTCEVLETVLKLFAVSKETNISSVRDEVSNLLDGSCSGGFFVVSAVLHCKVSYGT